MSTYTRPDPQATADPRHLAQLLGVESVDIDKEKVIVQGTPPDNAQTITNAYVYDPNFGRTQDEIDIDNFLAKASPTAADTVKAAKAMARKLRGRK